ncbi:MAG: hypothetical protein IPM79_24400 [Polyangiaceae bacterium]|nr:hypothetical protein [Polyangiaceae bacterium]
MGSPATNWVTFFFSLPRTRARSLARDGGRREGEEVLLALGVIGDPDDAVDDAIQGFRRAPKLFEEGTYRLEILNGCTGEEFTLEPSGLLLRPIHRVADEFRDGFVVLVLVEACALDRYLAAREIDREVRGPIPGPGNEANRATADCPRGSHPEGHLGAAHLVLGFATKRPHELVDTGRGLQSSYKPANPHALRNAVLEGRSKGAGEGVPLSDAAVAQALAEERHGFAEFRVVRSELVPAPLRHRTDPKTSHDSITNERLRT